MRLTCLTPVALYLLASTLVLLPGVCGQEGGTADLTIEVEDVRGAKGVVGVLLFASEEGWPEAVPKAYARKAVPARPGTTTVTLSGIASGNYALVVLHDENSNEKLDRNWLGVPKEGWGMSNNPKANMKAPAYGSARFELTGSIHLKIRLNY